MHTFGRLALAAMGAPIWIALVRAQESSPGDSLLPPGPRDLRRPRWAKSS